MTKRLTAEEVAAKIENEGWMADVSPGLVRMHLVPRWQDEPDGDGWYWVEGEDFPMCVRGEHYTPIRWEIWIVCAQDWESLNGRRVCPISERPKQ